MVIQWFIINVSSVSIRFISVFTSGLTQMPFTVICGQCSSLGFVEVWYSRAIITTFKLKRRHNHLKCSLCPILLHSTILSCATSFIYYLFLSVARQVDLIYHNTYDFTNQDFHFLYDTIYFAEHFFIALFVLRSQIYWKEHHPFIVLLFIFVLNLNNVKYLNMNKLHYHVIIYQTYIHNTDKYNNYGNN